jgi:hypothetical protein
MCPRTGTDGSTCVTNADRKRAWIQLICKVKTISAKDSLSLTICFRWMQPLRVSARSNLFLVSDRLLATTQHFNYHIRSRFGLFAANLPSDLKCCVNVVQEAVAVDGVKDGQPIA